MNATDGWRLLHRLRIRPTWHRLFHVEEELREHTDGRRQWFYVAWWMGLDNKWE
jgi:hypothetical protein